MLNRPIPDMIALPKWLKNEASAQRRMRLLQRRVTSDEARKQCVRVERESANPLGPIDPSSRKAAFIQFHRAV